MKHREKGLALLLVVSLMALVTLLVVSLAVVTRVETQVGATRATQDQARQNAQLALQVALGQLQELAGPDRRVTATGEATGSTSNRHWTGVWRSDTTGTVPLAWLVSGEGSDPSNDATPSRERVVLVGESNGTEETEVVAPLKVLAESGIARGAFAYFIADEGVKARLMPALSTEASNDMFEQRLPLLGGTRPVGFANEAEVDPLSATFQSQLEALSSREQFPALLGSADDEPTRERWHDYTTWSQGLLVDVNRGGLKTDLTNSGDTVIPGLSAFSDLITPDRTASLSPVYPIRAASGSSGDLYDGIHPIITQIGFQFSVNSRTNASLNLNVRSRLFIEMWNPYSSAISGEDLRVVISGLPTDISIEAQTPETDREHGTVVFDLSQALSVSTDIEGNAAVDFRIPFPIGGWPPGRIYNWRMPPSGSVGENGRILDIESPQRNGYWNVETTAALPGPDYLRRNSEFRFESETPWNIQIELWTKSGELLSEFEIIEFDSILTAWRDASSVLPDFGFNVRLSERRDYENPDRTSDWIHSAFPDGLFNRSADPSIWIPLDDLNPASYSEYFSNADSESEKEQLFNRDPSPDGEYWWGKDEFHQSFYNSDIALFELNRQRWRSVGSLQHLPFEGRSIYSVGNSWGEFNHWFDRYYFSDSTGDELSDEVSLIEGALNINSTRPKVWSAILEGLATGGTDYQFDYTIHNPETGEITRIAPATISTPIARFGQSAGEMWEISPNPNNLQAGSRQYRRGLRGLIETQVNGLANAISVNVQRRISTQGPYRSVEAFLVPDEMFGSGNILEYSIEQYDESVAANERINWDQYFPNTPMKIDQSAPSFITSADLVTALAPVVNVRSDTFVIRAYGESVEPTVEASYASSEPTSRAWLEAVVQRFPEGVDASDFVGGASGDWSQMIAEPQWGRKFRIIALRWLTEDDL